MPTQGIPITVIKHTLFAVVAAALMLIAATVPAVQATSLVEGGQLTAEEDSDDNSTNPALSHDEIKFLVDYWHLDAGVLTREDVPSEDGAVRPALSHDEIKFLVDYWHLDAATVTREDVLSEVSSTNPALTYDEIKFQEDNWGYQIGDEPGQELEPAPSLDQRRDEIAFRESNWNFRTGGPFDQQSIGSLTQHEISFLEQNWVFRGERPLLR